MRYHVLHIESRFDEEWQKELFDQTLCDFGVDTIDGNDYYIPSDVWEAQTAAVTDYLSSFNFQFSVESCPDENWNATWEAEHPMQELPLGVRIIPHCAFGAGHHETTSMMMESLINFKSQISNSQCKVLDHGTGTGVLAIFAKRLGAAKVVAVDIDEKSVANAQENAALNETEIEVLLGGNLDSLNLKPSTFNLIMANIHRNILLANMPAYAAHLRMNGELWISGFYEEDCAALQAAAEHEGLTLIEVLARNEWRMMRYRKEERP